MGRKPNTDRRRAEIAAALMQEMAEVGYERASVKSIAARAGLAPGLIHYHFPSKEAILLALLDGLIEQADARADAALAEAASPAARLHAYATARVGRGAGADPQQVRAWVVLIAEALAQPAVRARLAQWLERDHGRLKAWFAAANVPTPGAHASALLAMVMGSFSLHAMAVPGVAAGYALPQLQAWLDDVLPREGPPQADAPRPRGPRRKTGTLAS